MSETESMGLAEFAIAVQKTGANLKQAVCLKPGEWLHAKRCPGFESAPEHLAWMLDRALEFYADGKPQKANRWLGFVQGSMHADGYSSVEALKRANMPTGESFDPERV